MSAAHDFELLPHAAIPAEAVDAAEHGEVVYLTRNGEPVAAVVRADVAAAGAAAVEALEDADDLRATRAALAEPGPNVPLDDVLAKYADDLAAYPDER
jgi:antitoxin (DNA-binding transcriptional repressor) of toxin-antitoxin stability system